MEILHNFVLFSPKEWYSFSLHLRQFLQRGRNGGCNFRLLTWRRGRLRRAKYNRRILIPLCRLRHWTLGHVFVKRKANGDLSRLEIYIYNSQESNVGNEPEIYRGEERFTLGLQQPSRDEAHFMGLLQERLERLRLPQPARHVALEAGEFLAFDAAPEGLFADPENPASNPVAPLLERLRARLGDKAVSGLQGVEDHRPEYSWARREPGDPAPCQPLPHRPLWLFRQARRCRIEDYRVLAGPERIESGWWDGHDCRRDYFVVRDHGGSTLWAYREYKPRPGWYLQGLFA